MISKYQNPMLKKNKSNKVFSLIKVIMCIISFIISASDSALANSIAVAEVLQTWLRQEHLKVNLPCKRLIILKELSQTEYTGVGIGLSNQNYLLVNGDRDDNDWLRANRTTVDIHRQSQPLMIDRVKQTGLACAVDL